MMVDHWSILGLEELTRDVSAIRRAYAQKARECHPEEDLEGFLRLREAYQAALAYAERGVSPPNLSPADDAGKRDAARADDGEEAWEPEFTRLMLDKVTQVERELPPGKEFLAWLYNAYQFSASEKSVLDREAIRVEKYPREVTLGPGADFEGMESILRIAAKGAIWPGRRRAFPVHEGKTGQTAVELGVQNAGGRGVPAAPGTAAG